MRELSAGLRQALSRMDYLLRVPPLAGDSEQLSAPERSEGRAGMLARGAHSARKRATAWQSIKQTYTKLHTGLEKRSLRRVNPS